MLGIQSKFTISFRTKITKDALLMSLIVLFYILFCFYFFYRWVYPSMVGEISFRAGADSYTYIDTAKHVGSINNIKFSDVIKLSSNLFGPTFILLLTNFNYLSIFILNSVIMFLACSSLFKYYSFNRVTFAVLLIINPITLSSLTTINKEILGICGIFYILVYFRSRLWLHLLIALALSFFTRWQQFLFVIVLLPYLKSTLRSALSRNLLPFTVLVILSLVYPSLAPYLSFTGDTRFDNVQTQYAAAGGLLVFLNELQHNYLYVLAFPFKAILNYVGNLPRIITLLDSSTNVDYYNRIILGHQLVMFILIAVIYVRKTFKSTNSEPHMILLYSFLYCTALTVNYRYFYPIYPLFVILAISKKVKQIDV